MATITQYTIVATRHDDDLLAAMNACNKALGDAGETFSREAAEKQIAECRPFLQRGLKIEASEFEPEE